MNFIVNGYNVFIIILTTFLTSLILTYLMIKISKNIYLSCAVTGFLSAFLNTLFFMTALVVLFGNTEYMQGLIGGKNIILFVCGFVGINAVCEMVSSTILTGAVGAALYRAKFVPALEKSRG